MEFPQRVTYLMGRCSSPNSLVDWYEQYWCKSPRGRAWAPQYKERSAHAQLPLRFVARFGTTTWTFLIEIALDFTTFIMSNTERNDVSIVLTIFCIYFAVWAVRKTLYSSKMKVRVIDRLLGCCFRTTAVLQLTRSTRRVTRTKILNWKRW